MPASYTILKSARLKLVRIWGKTDYGELEALFFAFIRDADFQPDLRLLVDLRDMTDAITGLWEMSKLKQLYQYAYFDAVGAVDVVIVTKGAFATRVAKIFALLMRDRKPMIIHVTQSWSDALSRLGVPAGLAADGPGAGPGARVGLFGAAGRQV
jgi:hypothetical protein